jgi:heme/copper-type cytochrome/quinol oxidase subunit 2
MWGNILTEVSYIQNFNMSFSNNKADVLIHLTQWQYWWWFWFSFLWVLYYLLVARVFRYRTLKFNPRIASTLRPHGKWGDLLTCIIPVTWCINILINSNFILKLIEWQSESSLFTLRVRAKQWYWVYKLDLRNIADIFSAPRNIGRNKWQFATFGDLQTAEDYLHIMQMRAYNSWAKDFWADLNKKSLKKGIFSVNTPIDTYKTEFLKNSKITYTTDILNKGGFFINSSKTNLIGGDIMFTDGTAAAKFLLEKKKNNFLEKSSVVTTKKLLFDGFSDSSFFKKNMFKKLYPIIDQKKKPSVDIFNPTKTYTTNQVLGVNNYILGSIVEETNVNIHSDLDDESRAVKRGVGKTIPLRLLKKPKTDFFFRGVIENQNIELLAIRFNDKVPTIVNKPVKPAVYLTFKQKRYNQRTNIGKKATVFYNNVVGKNQTYSGNPFLKDISIIEENFGNPTRQYRLLKKAKTRLDTTRVSNWNRLLRARRVLVLPAHVNITVITNSFDIVHSWHIPGLGLKMDCLPGRATHHTLYIDNVGLYYGQCAEVCGRYHHHMPIRICALPFEHFLVWWHTFGLPKFLFPANKSNNNMASVKYFTRKFSW